MLGQQYFTTGYLTITTEYLRIYFRRELYFAAKRILDIVLAVAALVVCAPLMIVIILLIKWDSPGSAIFRQQRVGSKRYVDGDHEIWEPKSFTLYKFRTMRAGADSSIHQAFIRAFIRNDQQAMARLQDTNTNIFKLVNDKRVTRLGKFLRKTSLDELPQFWNVLRGDISLVGPRPALPYEVEEYLPWHYYRLNTVPGLTGLWQVTARSSVRFDEMVLLDLKYINRQSFWLDLKILIATPAAVLFGRGAA